ncbi:MAG: hypothetical protein NTY81_01625 [Candidatus Staskawiczbacteria bacterium]|nr:hypothetical protein [Candidatus Staskawiczbacteria bacterium]
MPEQKEEEQKKEGDGNSGNLASPEGILMLCVAGIIDAISLIPVINIISDILGIIIIGGWLLITRPGEAVKKAVKRFLIACGIELIPIVSIAPSWTWFVYKTLKDN